MENPLGLIQSALEREKSDKNFSDLLYGLHKKDSFRPHFPLSMGDTSALKQTLYLLSFGYNYLSHKLHIYKTGWWNEIIPGLYLGGLPLRSQMESFHKLGITLVISLVEDFERKPSLVASPVTQGMWQKEGISCLSLPHADFGPVFLTSLLEGATAIRDSLDKKGAVYVHCKAGKSRSAAVVLAYLSTYGGMSLDEAFSLTQKKRSIITLRNKWFHLRLYYHLYHAYFGPTENQASHMDDLKRLFEKNSLNAN